MRKEMKIAAARANVDPAIRGAHRAFQQSFSLRHSYPVYFTTGLLALQHSLLDELFKAAAEPDNEFKARVFCVLDSGLLPHYPHLIEALKTKAAQSTAWELVGEAFVLPGGEQAKNSFSFIESLYEQFSRLELDRHSYILAIGGGAVVDAVGFAAATAHRGIRLVRVPTTVLGQNDSGVGVKNSVNYAGSKNFLGTFAPPWAVINDSLFLSTLSRRDAVSGMAEAVKVALIKDVAFYSWLTERAVDLAQLEPRAVEELIERTALLHLQHIGSSGDPFESGSSRPLDFGHWAAHKLEALTNHELRHGEAVSIGIALDTLYSAKSGLLGESDALGVVTLLRDLGLPIYDPALEQHEKDGTPAYVRGLEEFRQHLGGRLSVTLLSSVGRGIQVHEMDLELLESSRQWLAAIARSH